MINSFSSILICWSVWCSNIWSDKISKPKIKFTYWSHKWLRQHQWNPVVTRLISWRFLRLKYLSVFQREYLIDNLSLVQCSKNCIWAYLRKSTSYSIFLCFAIAASSLDFDIWFHHFKSYLLWSHQFLWCFHEIKVSTIFH